MLPKLSENDLLAFCEGAEKVKLFDWLMIDACRVALYYRFLYLFCYRMCPSLMVELGTCEGVSSMCMAMGNPGGKVITIDNNPSAILEKCRRSNIKYLTGDSVASPFEPISNIDLLYIDTNHNGRALQEFNHWRPRLNKNALVLFDDVYLNYDMEKFWTSFKPEGPIKCDLPLHGKCGFGALKFNDAEEPKKEVL